MMKVKPIFGVLSFFLVFLVLHSENEDVLVSAWKFSSGFEVKVSQDVVENIMEEKKKMQVDERNVEMARENERRVRGIETENIVVKLKSGFSSTFMEEEFGCEYHRNVQSHENTHLWKVPVAKRSEMSSLIDSLNKHPAIEWAHVDHLIQYKKYQADPRNEPLWNNQWHLQNTGQNGGSPGSDANAIPAWDRGFTGRGIQICIVDDGLDHQHPDFRNYKAEDSYDFNSDDDDPSPGPDDSHGTACGGVAAAAVEGTCGAGAAFEADVSALRTISGPITTARLAEALLFSNQNNDIYSNSWGIDACNDQSQCTLVPTSTVIEESFSRGSNEGRGGKGNIYVFAAGNSRQVSSNVNYQNHVRSIYTISVAAYGNDGQVSFYSDPGCANLISAPSNGGSLGITTSDVRGGAGYSNGQCTNTFGGTSSACPLVAGVIALMLDANSDLTWRDVQDILVKSARKIDDGPNWQTNRAGLHVSHDYGFGSIDAGEAVKLARDRDDHLDCHKTFNSRTKQYSNGLQIPDNNQDGIVSELKVDNVPSDFDTIEHVMVNVRIQHTFRGDLQIALESPSKDSQSTVSLLALPRRDNGNDYDWSFKTNFHWGEKPEGTWKLQIADVAQQDTGSLISWDLTFYGKCKKKDNVVLVAVGATFAAVLTVAFVGFFGFVSYRHVKGNPLASA